MDRWKLLQIKSMSEWVPRNTSFLSPFLFLSLSFFLSPFLPAKPFPSYLLEQDMTDKDASVSWGKKQMKGKIAVRREGKRKWRKCMKAREKGKRKSAFIDCVMQKTKGIEWKRKKCICLLFFHSFFFFLFLLGNVSHSIWMSFDSSSFLPFPLRTLATRLILFFTNLYLSLLPSTPTIPSLPLFPSSSFFLKCAISAH